MSGRLIEIFLPEPDVPSYRQGRIANRSVKAIILARSELNRLTSEEAGEGGLYILVSEDDESGLSVYVGRSENVARRLSEHNRGSNVTNQDGAPADFSKILVFLGDDWQTVAHRMWLEAKLIEAMRSVSWVKVLNNRQEQVVSLNPAQSAVAREVLEDIRLLMPVLGLDVLERIVPRVVGQGGQQVNNRALDMVDGEPFKLDFAGVHADILVRGDRYVALKGSQFAATDVGALQPGYKELRRRLVLDGKVTQITAPASLVEDVEFRSPSALGSVITGQTLQSLDRIVHRDTEQTLREWLASQTPNSVN